MPCITKQGDLIEGAFVKLSNWSLTKNDKTLKCYLATAFMDVNGENNNKALGV